MLTPLLIEIGWYIVLASAWGSLLLSRRLSSGLARAWVAFLLLGLWYGYRGADYAWALQWTVYVTGILLLWAWLALESPQAPFSRWEPRKCPHQLSPPESSDQPATRSLSGQATR